VRLRTNTDSVYDETHKEKKRKQVRNDNEYKFSANFSRRKSVESFLSAAVKKLKIFPARVKNALRYYNYAPCNYSQEDRSEAQETKRKLFAVEHKSRVCQDQHAQLTSPIV
jgi:hypothetical protein